MAYDCSFHDLPSEMQEVIRSHANVLQRFLLSMTCERERSAWPARPSLSAGLVLLRKNNPSVTLDDTLAAIVVDEKQWQTLRAAVAITLMEGDVRLFRCFTWFDRVQPAYYTTYMWWELHAVFSRGDAALIEHLVRERHMALTMPCPEELATAGHLPLLRKYYPQWLRSGLGTNRAYRMYDWHHFHVERPSPVLTPPNPLDKRDTGDVFINAALTLEHCAMLQWIVDDVIDMNGLSLERLITTQLHRLTLRHMAMLLVVVGRKRLLKDLVFMWGEAVLFGHVQGSVRQWLLEQEETGKAIKNREMTATSIISLGNNLFITPPSLAEQWQKRGEKQDDVVVPVVPNILEKYKKQEKQKQSARQKSMQSHSHPRRRK